MSYCLIPRAKISVVSAVAYRKNTALNAIHNQETFAIIATNYSQVEIHRIFAP